MQMSSLIPIPTKTKQSKFKEAQDLSSILIETLANDLNGIDALIKSKAIANVTSNLSTFIQFYSTDDEIKTNLQNSRIKLSLLQRSNDEIEGHLIVLAEYIKNENKKHALEKIEKLFTIKDNISNNVNQLNDINKKCTHYCYSLWGYSMGNGNGGNEMNLNVNSNANANESDSSLNNSSSINVSRKEFDDGRKRSKKKNCNRKKQSLNSNSKSPACLYLKDSSANKCSMNKTSHNISPSLFVIESNNNSNSYYNRLNTNPNSNKNKDYRSPLFEINKCNSSNPVSNTKASSSAFNQCPRKPKKELNKTQKSFTLSNSLLSCSNNKDSKCSISLSDDNISFYQSKIKELIKEVEKINESLIEEKSINTDLKFELNKCKESHSIPAFMIENQCSIKDNCNSKDIVYLKDISEMIYNILSMENQLRKSVSSLSFSIPSSSLSLSSSSSVTSFDFIEFSKGHNSIKDHLIHLVNRIELIKETIEQQVISKTNCNNNKVIYNEILSNKDSEIKELKMKLESLSPSLSSIQSKPQALVTSIDQQREDTNISNSALNKEIRELKDLLTSKEKELSESNEIYQSDIQSKKLIESLLKTELQSIQKTYESLLKELKDEISKKDSEITQYKQKQSSNELLLINQLKQNHQKNIAQLKELYTQSINNKNEAIDSLTKHCNTLRSTRQEHQSLLSSQDNTPSINREEIVRPFKDEISKLKKQILIKDNAINDYQTNIDSICKKTVNEKLKQHEMEKLFQKQNDYEVEVLNDKLKALTEQNELYYKQIRELCDQVNELDIKEKELINQLDSKDNEVLELTGNISQLEKKVEIKESAIEELECLMQRNKNEMMEQMKDITNEYELKIEESNAKKIFKQISFHLIQISIPPSIKLKPKRMETYAFSLYAKLNHSKANKLISKYEIDSNTFSIVSIERIKTFSLKKLDVVLLNISALTILADKPLKKQHTTNNIIDSWSFSINNQSNKSNVQLKMSSIDFSLNNNKKRAFDQKILRKFSNYVLIKPTLHIAKITMSTSAFSLDSRRNYRFIKEKLIKATLLQMTIENTILNWKFDITKTSMISNETSVYHESKIINKQVKSNAYIIDYMTRINIEGIDMKKVDETDNRFTFKTNKLMITHDPKSKFLIQNTQSQQNALNNNPNESLIPIFEKQLSILNSNGDIVKLAHNACFNNKDIKIISKINNLYLSHYNYNSLVNDKEMLKKKRESDGSFYLFEPIVLNAFTILSNETIKLQSIDKETQTQKEIMRYEVDMVKTQIIFYASKIDNCPLPLSIPTQAQVNSHLISLSIVKSNDIQFDIKPFINKTIALSMSQLQISIESLRTTSLIPQITQSSFNISSITKTPNEPQSVISIQLLKTKHITLNKSQTQSPYSSKYDNEEDDEESEYTEDNEEYEKLKDENCKLQTEAKALNEENEILNSKLSEVESVLNQEREEFVGHLRLAFEKMIIEIQITSKAKEYVTAILRMLSYSDDDILDIYNQIGKKKGLFGFLR